ncbi:MAG TPA: MBL fold metallo-hydrolase, partial [Caulobacteraceae bacterium]|nr:MBL fold metallo-hydrolase [Caulobacteraceae bacterium]
MRDGFEDGETGRGRLVYPFADGPRLGESMDVAPGVKWMRMPLGGSLAWINVWALKDEGGWAIVDTGMQTP